MNDPVVSRHLYGWATPNTHRVSILLEELGLDYRVTGVNIRARAQFAPEILALNPFGKVPILVEEAAGAQPLVLFESGAILLHLAEAHGRFLPTSGGARSDTLAWLMVALTGLGPATGQAHHWTELAPEKPAAARAYALGQVDRVYRLLDGRLAAQTYLAGTAYSIADIAAFPWVARHGWAEHDLALTPHVARWHARLAQRPAVQRGMAVPRGAILA
ncbi:glutathione S-transferase family protein [Roseomonas rosulenta]|uniref:glutathione S-transferase family protein n=1 Tax=Roseomonas rosulenta TaxID=2748667 RepID=UPI0018E031DD|nr:glutathione binding-like protein [Roseomonas rosulenta]